MSRSLVTYILHYLLVVLLQLLVFNHLDFLGLIHPYIYLILIIILPLHYSRVSVILIAFMTGFIIDVFSQTYGLHMIASTLIGFVRPYLLGLLILDDSDDIQYEVHFHTIGIRRFLIFVMIMVFLHHLALYMVESFSFHDFLNTFMKIILSTISSAIIIFVYELLVFFRR